MVRVVRKKGKIDLKKLRQIAEGLDKETLKVGWFESARYDAETPVAGIAAIQEFGSASGGIPPRPFMRPTIENNKDDWIETLKIGLKQSLKDGTKPADTLEIMGIRIAGQIRKSITAVTSPPLSPITLALRKHTLAGKKFGGAFVGKVAGAIAAGKTGPGELGDSSGINPKPLVFEGIMLNTVTHLVEDK